MAQLRRPFEEFEEENPSVTVMSTTATATAPRYDDTYDHYDHTYDHCDDHYDAPSLRSVTTVVTTDTVMKEDEGAQVTEKVTQYTSTTIVGGDEDDEDDADRVLQQQVLRTNNYYALPPAQANPAAFDYANQEFFGEGTDYANQANQVYVAPFSGDEQPTTFYRSGDDTAPTGRPAS